MKTIKKSFVYSALLYVVSSACVTAHAQTSARPAFRMSMDTAQSVEVAKEFSFKVLPDNSEDKFILAISNPKSEKLTIHVRTSTGESYYDVTSDADFRRRMDMTTADDGKYTVVVSSAKKTLSKDIELQTTTKVVRTLKFN